VPESLEEFRVRFRAEVRADREAELRAQTHKDEVLKKIREGVDKDRDEEVKAGTPEDRAERDLEEWYASHPDREEGLREHMTLCKYEHLQIEKNEERKKRRTT
jgi:hypothetical protein